MRRQTSLLLRNRCSQVRSVATAAKQKPNSAFDAEPAVLPPPQNLGKWARPQPAISSKAPQAAANADLNKWSRPSPSPNAVASSSKSPLPSHTHSWAKSTGNFDHLEATESVVLPPMPNFNKWAKPNPTTASSKSSAASTWPRSRSPSLPQTPSLESPSVQKLVDRWGKILETSKNPPPNALGKWGKAAPPPKRSTSSRLDRDVAPHTDLANKSPPLQRDRAAPSQRTAGSFIRSDRHLPPHSQPRTNSTPSSRLDRGVAPHLEPHISARDRDWDGASSSDHDKTYSSPDIIPNQRDDTRRGRREAFKSRRSLVSGLDEEELVIPGQSKLGPGASRTKLSVSKVKKSAPRVLKRRRVDVYIPSIVSVGQLARLLNVKLERLQRKMVEAGMENETSYDYVLTSEYAALLAGEFGRNPVVNDEAAFDIYPPPLHASPTTLPHRPPIITIMGHVDHGKTTLLDTLRSSSVAKGEAGGITQHIGAFSVPVTNSGNVEGPKTITFLDTPGHAAFSAMRARGAGVTDIVVLVVAADDGVMPQTKEVIELIKKDKGKVGVVVAINKVDKPGADVDAVQKALLVEGIQLETFGGDVPSVEVSGLTGQGLDDLVETLSAMAEMQDLRAEREGNIHGYVLESKMLKGLGPVATVLILQGCLKPGSHIIGGTTHGKVRIMTDSSGSTVKAAYPGMAITVSGWKELPKAGDEVLQGTESDIKKALANRMRKAEVEAELVDVEAINAQRRHEREVREAEEQGLETAHEKEPEGPKELRLIVKGDVSGSVEAVAGALEGIGNKEAVVKVVSTGVGDVSEGDIMMAKAVDGMVVAFSVNIPRSMEVLAAQNQISLYSSTIIYRIMDEMKARVIALLPPIIERKVTGEANVQEVFDITLKRRQTIKVAGCRVFNGLVEKAKSARVVRDGVAIHHGKLETLRHMKKDVVEARKGMECGLSFDKFDDLREGDLIQVYQEIEKPGIL